METTSAQIGSCKEIDEHQVEHACLHSFAGPFRNVTASTASPPDVSHEHTAYRVTLPAVSSPDTDADADAAAPSAPTYAGSVSFVPEEDGEYAIYTSSPAAELSASDEHGKSVSFECTTEVPEDLCSGLRLLRVADFEHESPVTLTFESSEPGVLLLIEHLGRGHGHGHDGDDNNDNHERAH
ncbi:MAG: hypothetical protein KF837_06610 [Labilithrix sp.]|nr:hypothetical protein [Labilithrix sp.]